MSVLGINPGMLLGIFAASIAGSVHCVGMCGGLMLTATGTRLRQQFIYHLARLIAYWSLGFFAGWFGESLLQDWRREPIQVFFLFLLAFGLLMVFLKGLSRFSSWGIELGYRVRDASVFRPLMIGLFTVFLPCGWLYSFILLSLTIHDPWGGSLILFVFWLGTLPALMGSRILLQGVLSRFGLKGPKVVTLLMVMAALFSLGTHFYHSRFPNLAAGGHNDCGNPLISK